MNFFKKSILHGCFLCSAIFVFLCMGCVASDLPPPSETPNTPADASVEPSSDGTAEALTVGVSRSVVAAAAAAGSPTLMQPSLHPDADRDFCLGETVFIGDSRTNGLLTYHLLPPEQVYAIDGSNQESIQNRKFVKLDETGAKLTITEAVAIRRPRQIVVAFGINAIPVMEEDTFFLEYDTLITSLLAASPNSKIILQSIQPVSWWKFQEIPTFNNQLIDHYNDLLYLYAEDNGYFYLNLADLFKGADNALRTSYDAGDGLHFNTKAYTMLLDFYRSYLVFE